MQPGGLRNWLLFTSVSPCHTNYIFQALGIDALHNMGIMHRNLKAEHILIDPQENVKVSDFDHAFMQPHGSLHRWGAYTAEPVGESMRMAPEMLHNRSVSSDKMKPYGIAVDWWGLGLLLFELVSQDHKARNPRSNDH